MTTLPHPVGRLRVTLLAGALALAGCGGEPATVTTTTVQAAAPTASPTAPPTPTAEAAPSDPCEFVDVAAMTKAMRDSLGGGELSIDRDPEGTLIDGNKLLCLLTVPDTHTLDGTGSTVMTATTGVGLWLTRHRYADNDIISSGVYDVECPWGGDNPKAVYTSTFECNQELAAAQNPDFKATRKPVLDGGIVTDGSNSAVVAAPGDYWYEVDMTGIPGSKSHVAPLVALGRVLLKQ